MNIFMKTFPSVAAAIVALVLAGAWAPPVIAQELADEDIATAVRNELQTDLAVAADDIRVSAIGGIITLSGEANNLLERRRAERVAEGVRGVRGVLNEVTIPTRKDVNDEALQEDIKNALLYDSAADSYEVDVTARDGVVTLTGAVNSWQEKQITERVVAGVRGVSRINNNLRIDYDTERADEEIAAEIRRALDWNALVDDALITVGVDDGQVTLIGTVGSVSEKTEAIGDAWVAGVKGVNTDNLKVAMWARDDGLRGDKFAQKSDDEVESAVLEALVYDPQVFSFEITPTASNGVVTLRGNVDSVQAMRSAAETARGVVGVRHVINNINVQRELPPTDAELRDRVVAAMARDPYVESFDFAVSVENGIATLAGAVDSYYEKAHADDIASRANGIVAVNNNLTVEKQTRAYAYNPYVDDWYFNDYGWYDYKPAQASASDAEILDDINDELWWSPFVDSDDVNVTVEDGTATLTGTVQSWSEFNSATENAYEGGAAWVDNNLIVQ